MPLVCASVTRERQNRHLKPGPACHGVILSEDGCLSTNTIYQQLAEVQPLPGQPVKPDI